MSILLLVCYSMAVHTAFTGDELGSFSWYSYEKYKDQIMSRAKAFSVIILMVGCLEFLLCCGSIGYVAHAYKRDQKRVRNAHIPNAKMAGNLMFFHRHSN